jgi:Na+:H+ antiporter, NhaA family
MKKAIVNFVVSKAQSFVQMEAASSIVLGGCTASAMILANSSLSEAYEHLLHLSVFGLSLQHWINDGLMTVFFFFIGMEIKREIVAGELSSFKKASLPIFAATGGMVVPALFYMYFNMGGVHINGWAIPMATDIAFALGILSLLGPRVPLSLKVFLLALAIVDDLGAILVIASVYTQTIEFEWLLFAALGIVGIVASKKLYIKSYLLFIFFGIITWLGFLNSGVHATIAGVLVGLLTPLSFPVEKNSLANYSPLEDLIDQLHPWVSFGIMPIFALANAGIVLSSVEFSAIPVNTVAQGVFFGLLLGKPLGIVLVSFIAVALGLASLPDDLNWKHVTGASLLGGIGFTMSIFISGLSISGDQIVFAKIAILSASIFSALLGFVVLFLLFRKT